MAAGLYGFRVKVDASGVRSGLKRKFILHIDYVRNKTIGDIICSVQNILNSKKNIVLFVDDYYLPASESIHALRDGDEITIFCEAAFNDDTSDIAKPGENDIENSEWKKKKKYKKEENTKYEKKQKRRKYKAEASECIADLSNIKRDEDSEIFHPDTTGNVESEQGSMFVNCSSLLASSDECQAEESLRTSVKAPNIETDYEDKQEKPNKEEENLKKRKREQNSGAAQNSCKYDRNNKLKKYAIGHLIEVLQATEGEVAHAFKYSKTNEQIAKQENTLSSPDVLNSKEGAVTQTEDKTEDCINLAGLETVDNMFKFSHTKDPVNSSVSQTDAWVENKRKRKRKRTHKKNKIHKLDAPVKKFASSEIKMEESQSASCRHIRFADVEENAEDSKTKLSANTTVIENLENSANTTVTENATVEISEDPIEVSTVLNSAFTLLQENEAEKLQSTSLEQNTTRKSTQWDVKPDVPDASAFSKLLSLGWSSTPRIYERKKPTKTETTTIIKKDDVTKNAENSPQETSLINGHKEMNGVSLPVDASLTTEKIMNYPALETSPRKKDILAFKILRMGEDYTPQMSGYIVAEVKSFCPDSQQMELSILQGADQCIPPKGKFDITTDDEEGEINPMPESLRLNWNELVETKILYP